jgi:2-ketocyclohexanecarboxyl-CoA hydrolase
MQYEDILCRVDAGVAYITINRPAVMNAFRSRTCEELIHAFNKAGWDKAIGVICSAVLARKHSARAEIRQRHDGNYDGRGILPIEKLQTLIRDVPKPVIRAFREKRKRLCH